MLRQTAFRLTDEALAALDHIARRLPRTPGGMPATRTDALNHLIPKMEAYAMNEHEPEPRFERSEDGVRWETTDAHVMRHRLEGSYKDVDKIIRAMIDEGQTARTPYAFYRSAR